MRRKTLLGILLILTLAVASRWLLVQNQPAADVTGSDIDMRFDYVLSNFELRTYSRDGQLSALLQAPSLNQAAVSLQGVIREPRLSIPENGDGRVTLSAERATVSSDKNEINFSGTVVLQHTSDPGGLTTVTTDELTFDISAQIAHTEQQVHVARAGMQLTGTGMEADIGAQRYRLLSKVEGSYDQD